MDQFRHEIKYFINSQTAIGLSKKLDTTLKRDIHCAENAYSVRSLYYEDIYKSSLVDKLNGNPEGRKFRLRYYNEETDAIRAEIKVKKSGFIKKYAEPIGDMSNWNLMSQSEPQGVLGKYMVAYKQKKLRPKVILYYKRWAWIYQPLNIRITIDYDLKYSENVANFIDEKLPMYAMGDERLAILEVKYNDYLPIHIKKLLTNLRSEFVSISKYAMAMEAIEDKNTLRLTGGL